MSCKSAIIFDSTFQMQANYQFKQYFWINFKNQIETKLIEVSHFCWLSLELFPMYLIKFYYLKRYLKSILILILKFVG